MKAIQVMLDQHMNNISQTGSDLSALATHKNFDKATKLELHKMACKCVEMSSALWRISILNKTK